MRAILLTTLLLAGCGSDTGVADQGVLPLCPPGAGAIHFARCDPRVDTVCDCHSEPDCYFAHCLCDGYWESDAVLRICDGGMPD
jgi:hypothetical protein